MCFLAHWCRRLRVAVTEVLGIAPSPGPPWCLGAGRGGGGVLSVCSAGLPLELSQCCQCPWDPGPPVALMGVGKEARTFQREGAVQPQGLSMTTGVWSPLPPVTEMT